MGINLSRISINYKNESKKIYEIMIYFIIVVNKNHFEFLYIIGRGGFGKVWKVRLKKQMNFLP